MFMDIFSRKIVGYDVHEIESMELSSELIGRICKEKEEDISKGQLTLHSDNGGPMKGATMLATLQMLGIMPSFSRPKVSDDNPYSEALFKEYKKSHNIKLSSLKVGHSRLLITHLISHMLLATCHLF